MISLEKLKVYQQFNGDIDGWARSTKGTDPSGICDDDWYVIERLRSGLFLIDNEPCSQSYKESVFNELQEKTEDEATRNFLRKISLEQK